MITTCTRFTYVFFKGSGNVASLHFHLKYFKIDILMSSHFSQIFMLSHSDHSSLAMHRDLLCIRNYKN